MRRFTSYILIIILTAAAYSQLPGNVFVDMDDQLLIIDNEAAHGITMPHVKTAFTTYDPELYVPLTLLTYQLEYSLFGLNPTAFHLTNLLLHIGSAVLVFAIFRRFFSEKISLCCALLFAVHPINVEAIAWASGRKDVLSSFFFLLSLLLYLRWRNTAKGYTWSVVSFAFGLLAKVSIAPLPLLLLLVDWLQGRSFSKAVIREKVPYFLLAGIFVVIALLGKPQAGDMLTWMLLSFVGIPFYLRSYVVPLQLSILYPFDGTPSLAHPWILVGIALTVVLTVVAVLSLRKTKALGFAWAWFLLLLAPAFPTVIKGGGDAITMLYYASDRYVYLAGLGLLFLVGTILQRLNSVRAYQVTALCIGVFCLLTFRQVLVWRDSESLYRNVLSQGRQSHIAYLSLARLAGERGNLAEALELYTNANTIEENSKALLNMGQIYALQGKYDQAIDTYQLVVDRWPDLADVHGHIGRLYLERGLADQAIPYFVQALSIKPDYVPALFHLGVIFEEKDMVEEAIMAYKQAYEVDSTDPQIRAKLIELGEL